MTGSDVLLDTSAWWEILRGTTAGNGLRARFLGDGRLGVHTSALTLGELAAKLTSLKAGSRLMYVVSAIRRCGTIHDVTAQLAVSGGIERERLRGMSANASLADGIILSTAREIGARLVSSDRAFEGQPELVRFTPDP